MKRLTYNDWSAYWSKISDLEELRKKSDNIDETLVSLEKEQGNKLLAGDHMLIIAALEERIDWLEEHTSVLSVEATGQITMFAA